ncbi:MAG: EscU/YscU/HrcU family type III secretion system export apparatus switch protein [Oryzihumus sp.]
MSDKSQKTEKPTPQRRREAVKEGRIARSADVSAWLTVLAVSFLAPVTVRHTRELFTTLMGQVQQVIADPQPQRATELVSGAVTGMLGALAPLLFGTVVVALVGNVAQGGLRVSSKRFKPKWEHLNVAKGIKRMVGAQAAWSLAKTLLKFGLLGVVAWMLLKGVVAQFTGTAWSLSSAMLGAVDAAQHLLRVVAVVGLVIAAADYLVERRRVEKSMMMSREEIKREARQSEGDPHQKGARLGRQRELSRNRMISNVRDADVVMVNPTHVAVALKYESGSGAPRVVAKGAGAVATRIREEAATHRLPMVEDVPLARALYAACEVGEEIPVALYDAVARVLAFVMSLRLRGTAVGVHRSPVPRGLVPTP